MEKSTKYTIVLLAILAILLLFLSQTNPPPPATASYPPPSPALSLSPQPPRENQALELRLDLTPSCTYTDGQLAADGHALSGATADGSIITAPIRLSSGRHLISYDSGACHAALRIEVLPALCKDGASRACSNARGCAGSQECKAGVWLTCRVPAPVCAPNIKVPCPIDSCSWGTATCNSCGSGWSKCK